MIACNVEKKVQRSKSGQTMVEYAIVMVMLLALVAVCALLLYALRGARLNWSRRNIHDCRRFPPHGLEE